MKQRKTDDNLLLAMLKQGKQQKEIAQFFKVSPAAVCKRIKRLLPKPQEVLDKYNLTDQQKRFVIEKVRGKTNTQAVLASYEVNSLQSAKVIGSQLMDKLEVKMAIGELMDYHGMGRSYRIGRLKNHIDNQDPVVSLKALDLSWRLDGSYAPEKHINLEAKMTYLDILHQRHGVSLSLREILQQMKDSGIEEVDGKKIDEELKALDEEIQQLQVEIRKRQGWEAN